MAAKLIFRSGAFTGKYLSLPLGKTIVLGRNRDIDMPLPDLKLSRRHCSFMARENGFFVSDLGSTNGTYLNGLKLETALEHAIEEFDRIVIGDTEMELSGGDLPDTFVQLSKEESEQSIPELDFDAERSSTESGQIPATSVEESAIKSPGDSSLEAADLERRLVDSTKVAASHSSSNDSVDEKLSSALREMLLPLPQMPGSKAHMPSVQVPAVQDAAAQESRRPSTKANVPLQMNQIQLNHEGTGENVAPTIHPPSQPPQMPKSGFLQKVVVPVPVSNAPIAPAASLQTGRMTPSPNPPVQTGRLTPAPNSPIHAPVASVHAPVAPIHAPVAPVAPVQTKPVKNAPTLDDILAGLDQEPMVVDMNKKSRAHVVEGGPYVRSNR